jgi:hypothetical protein
MLLARDYSTRGTAMSALIISSSRDKRLEVADAIEELCGNLGDDGVMKAA